MKYKEKIFQWGSLIIVLIFTGLFIFLAELNPRFSRSIPLIGDEPTYLAIADSLKTFKTVNLVQEEKTQHYLNFFGPTNLHTVTFTAEKHYPKHGLGWPLILTPLFFVWQNPRLPAMFIQCLIVVLLAWNLFLWLRELKFSFPISLFVPLVITFSIPLAIQAHQVFSEPLAALCLVYSLRKWSKPNFLSCLATAYLPWIHFKYLIFLPVLLWPYFSFKKGISQPKLVLERPFAIVVLSIIGLLVFNWYAYGTPLSGQERAASFLQQFDGLLGTWISRENGLLPFAPVYLLSFLGLGALFKGKRLVFWQIILTGGLLWLLTAVFSSWPGGQAPPARMILPALVVLAPALAVTLVLPFKWFFRFVFMVLFIPGLILSFRSILQPFNIIDRPSYPQLNSLTQYLDTNLDLEKLFTQAHHLGFNLNLFWLLLFILLFLSGIILIKYQKKLRELDESINHYPRL